MQGRPGGARFLRIMHQHSNNTDLGQLLSNVAEQVQSDLDRWLADSDTPAALAEAMRYCTTGGKRLRPAMVLLTAGALGQNPPTELTRRAGLAVELIHAYSLVHDDLPAMDDDDLRRGQPTAHVKYGEAMAILIGDALQARAFELLTETGEAMGATLAHELARAAGATGMVAGQVADMDLCDVPDGLDGLKYVHTRKTGAMLRASARMGAIAAGADEPTLAGITDFAEHLGLAFQICDDLLDATATRAQLGKTPGKDAQSGKRTYLTVLGKDQAETLAEEHTRLAISALDVLGSRGEVLRKLAEKLLDRQH